MSVQAVENPRIVYQCDGLTKEFIFPYEKRDMSDIKVQVIDPDGRSKYVYTNIRYIAEQSKVIYPDTGDPIASGYKIAIYRLTPVTQDAIFPDVYPYPAVSRALDKMVMIIQDQYGLLTSKFGDAKTIFDIGIDKVLNYMLASKKSADDALTIKNQTQAIYDKGKSDINTLYDNANVAANDLKNKTEAAAVNAQNSETGAKGYRDQAEALLANSKALESDTFDPLKTYSYPMVVSYTDGYSYRCIGVNVKGENPNTSHNWVRASVITNDFWDIDNNGGLMPAVSPTYSADFELDGQGNIEPKEVI